MTKKHRCPECNQWMDIAMVGCECGWKVVKPAIPVVADHRCIYQHSGKRCPFPGTISTSVHASSPMHCLEHYLNLNNSEHSLKILMSAENNFIAMMENRIHWVIRFIPDEYQKVKNDIHNLYLKLFRK